MVSEVTAKQVAHGPAHMPRTASAARAFRPAAALGTGSLASDHSQNPRITVVTIREPRGIALMLTQYIMRRLDDRY